MKKINVILYGCGVMGRKVAEAVLNKNSLQIVGALDIDDQIVGKDLGEILENPEPMGIKIEKDPEALLDRTNAQAVVLTTTSHLKGVRPQIEQCLKHKLNVISTCEELSYPWNRYPELTREIHEMAVANGVTVIGTGINPGYLMDTLPLVLTAPCLSVDSVRVTRMMDSSKRRIPFQKKVGTGMTQREFREKIDQKIITGHVGLLESIHMIASGLDWELDEATELPPQPVITDREIETGLGTVKPGDVIGLTSIAYAKRDGKEVITLEFNANADVDEEYDEVVIHGIPKIHERILGGVHGDVGTVAVTVNTIPKAVEALPGVKTMKDIPPVSVTP